MRAFLAAILCVPLALILGCDNKPSRQTTDAEKDKALATSKMGGKTPE